MTSANLAPATRSGDDVLAGARAMLAGIVPFGLIPGVSAAHAKITKLAGWLTRSDDLRRQPAKIITRIGVPRRAPR